MVSDHVESRHISISFSKKIILRCVHLLSDLPSPCLKVLSSKRSQKSWFSDEMGLLAREHERTRGFLYEGSRLWLCTNYDERMRSGPNTRESIHINHDERMRPWPNAKESNHEVHPALSQGGRINHMATPFLTTRRGYMYERSILLLQGSKINIFNKHRSSCKVIFLHQHLGQVSIDIKVIFILFL